jgi:hypothetical protein
MKVLNAEVLGERRVTLQLEAVAEREALDIVLRDLAGYVLGLRAASANALSEYGTLVLAVAGGQAPRGPSPILRPPITAHEVEESVPVATTDDPNASPIVPVWLRVPPVVRGEQIQEPDWGDRRPRRPGSFAAKNWSKARTPLRSFRGLRPPTPYGRRRPPSDPGACRRPRGLGATSWRRRRACCSTVDPTPRPAALTRTGSAIVSGARAIVNTPPARQLRARWG